MSRKVESQTAPGTPTDAPAIFSESKTTNAEPGALLAQFPTALALGSGTELAPYYEAAQELIRDPVYRAAAILRIQERQLLDLTLLECFAREQARQEAQKVAAAQARRDSIIESSHHAFATVALDDPDELFSFFTSRLGMKLRKEMFVSVAPGATPSWEQDTEHSTTIDVSDYLAFIRKEAKQLGLDPTMFRLALSSLSSLTIVTGSSADFDALSRRFQIPQTLSWSSDDGDYIRLFSGPSTGFFKQSRFSERADWLTLFKSVRIIGGTVGLPWPGSPCRWIVSPKQFEQTVKPDAMCELPALPSELSGILRDCAGARPVVLPRALSMMIERGK